MECLDESWVNKIKAVERPYDHFYKEPTIAVDIICVYVNPNGEAVTVAKQKHQILSSGGVLPKEALLEIIKANKCRNGVRYCAGTIAKYNFTIEPDEVISLDTIDARNYLHSQKYYGNVVFEDTIALFQDVNALIIIFVEPNSRNRLTRHIRHHKPIRLTRRKKG